MNKKELGKYALLGLANGVFSVCVILLYEVGSDLLKLFYYLWDILFSKNRVSSVSAPVDTGINIHAVSMLRPLDEIILTLLFLIIACSLASVTVKFLFDKRIKSEITFWQSVGFCFIAGTVLMFAYRALYEMYEITPNFDWAIFQECFFSSRVDQTPIVLVQIMISNLLFALSINQFTKRRLR